jgi:hypothetical protein
MHRLDGKIASPGPWSFSRRTTAATSLEQNCLWMVASHKCKPAGEVVAA